MNKLRLLLVPVLLVAASAGAAINDTQIREAYHQSYRYEKSQNYADAIKALMPVLEEYPQGYTLNLRLGWLHYLQGGFATARGHYETAVKVAPYSLEAKLGHTLPLLAQERWAEAEAVVRQVLRLDAGNYLANLRLAYALRLQQKFDAADEVVNRMLVSYPTDIALLSELALLKVAQGQGAEAGRIFNDILILDPENVTAKAQLSKLK